MFVGKSCVVSESTTSPSSNAFFSSSCVLCLGRKPMKYDGIFSFCFRKFVQNSHIFLIDSIFHLSAKGVIGLMSRESDVIFVS